MFSTFSLTAWDIRRLFELAITFYIRAFIPYLLYLFGAFTNIYYQSELLVVLFINCLGILLGFKVLFQLYSAWTMSISVRKILRGEMLRDTLFTVQAAESRISKVIVYSLLSLVFYICIVTEITLPKLGSRETLLLWLMLGSWIVLGFIYSYCRFFIDRGRTIIENYGNI